MLLAILFVVIDVEANAFSYYRSLRQYKHRCRIRRSDLKTELWSRNLVPEQNPFANPDSRSTAGVAYGSVFKALQEMFPSAALEQRNTISRSEAYWPYVRQGQDPPQRLTYGEFDFYFFAELLDMVQPYLKHKGSGTTFCDIGSGAGRLVLAAAALHPEFRLCRGIEILTGLCDAAKHHWEDCSSVDGCYNTFPNTDLSIAPVEFVCGSFCDHYVYFGDANLVFCFSSCMGEDMMQALGEAIGRQLKIGSIVITTDYMLPLHGVVPPILGHDLTLNNCEYRLSLVEKVDGWCWLTGGASTAFVHRVEQSLALGKLEQPKKTLEDQCLEVVHAYETGTSTDTQRFLRNVYNNMVFNGLPERFFPKIEKEQNK